MELIGIAFVVVIMVFGLLLFIGFSVSSNTGGTDSPAVREARNYGSALNTAMLATTVQDCGYSLATALERCATASHLTCGSTTVCNAAHSSWVDMLENTVTQSGLRFNARIMINEQQFSSGSISFVHNEDACEGIRFRDAAPSQPISTNQGVLRSIIEFC